ncbi:hypothetical protein D3C83_121720 [compost metagenome]
MLDDDDGGLQIPYPSIEGGSVYDPDIKVTYLISREKVPDRGLIGIIVETRNRFGKYLERILPSAAGIRSGRKD